MIDTRNNPIVISGPSGSGKSELIEYIEKEYPTFLEATGITTRAKREIEVGRMYFVSKAEFENLISTDGLIEYCIYLLIHLLLLLFLQSNENTSRQKLGTFMAFEFFGVMQFRA